MPNLHRAFWVAFKFLSCNPFECIPCCESSQRRASTKVSRNELQLEWPQQRVPSPTEPTEPTERETVWAAIIAG